MTQNYLVNLNFKDLKMAMKILMKKRMMKMMRITSISMMRMKTKTLMKVHS